MTENNEFFEILVGQFKAAVVLDATGAPEVLDMGQAYQAVAMMKAMAEDDGHPVWETIAAQIGAEYAPVFPQLRSRFEHPPAKGPLCFVGEMPVLDFPGQ